jgi:hypothetical protein
MENPTVPEFVEVKKTSKSSLRTLLFIFIPILLLIALLFVFKDSINDLISNTKDSICKEYVEKEESRDSEETKQEEVADTTQDTQEKKEPLVIEEGQLYTIQATVPDGWSLKLAYNGEGSSTLMSDSNYSGLTGIEVKKDSTTVFSMNAISGIGMADCDTYYTFADSTPLDKVAIEEESGNPITIVDLSKETFTKVSLLEKDFRRIGSTYYENIGTDSKHFEPTCYLGITSFKNLFANQSINGADKEEVNSYTFKVTKGLTEEDYKILDSILNSVELVKYE